MTSFLNPAEIDRRLDRAVQQVTRAWFPANSAQLRQIQSGLRTGIYKTNVDELIASIRSDFSLLIYCLRELYQQAKEEGDAHSSNLSAEQLLRWGGLARLRPILLVDEKSISPYALKAADHLQAGRLVEAMTSAATAELLANGQGIDSDYAYFAALMRQLGQTLIAWNYPLEYEAAVNSLKTVGRLDLALTQVMGFPPNLLALGLARQWALPETICTIIAQPLHPPHSLRPKTIDPKSPERVAYLCMVGEALARANDPESYPTASDDWEFARAEIQETLGPDGIEKISSHLTNSYLYALPSDVVGVITLEPEQRVSQHEQSEVARLNPFLEECEPNLQRAIRRLYHCILSQQSVQRNLQLLMREVLPSSSFTGGCIYTVDPTANRLVPRTRYGTIRSNIKGAVDYLPYVAESDLINSAFRIDHPIVEKQKTSESGEIVSFAAGVGPSEKLGVLYLETSAEQAEKQNIDMMRNFEAIHKALTDCLEMSRIDLV